MQLHLFADQDQAPQRMWQPPLCPVPDTIYRLELRALWCPRWQRGTAAFELTDHDTRELIGWQLLPGAKGLQELAQHLDELRGDALRDLDYLDSPF